MAQLENLYEHFKISVTVLLKSVLVGGLISSIFFLIYIQSQLQSISGVDLGINGIIGFYIYYFSFIIGLFIALLPQTFASSYLTLFIYKRNMKPSDAAFMSALVVFMTYNISFISIVHSSIMSIIQDVTLFIFIESNIPYFYIALSFYTLLAVFFMYRASKLAYTEVQKTTSENTPLDYF